MHHAMQEHLMLKERQLLAARERAVDEQIRAFEEIGACRELLDGVPPITSCR